MLNVGPLELLVVLAVALIVVGPERLPELARSVGRALRQFRDVQDEVRDMVSSSVDDDTREIVSEFKKAAGGVKRATDIKGAVRRAGRSITDDVEATPPSGATPHARGSEPGGPPADRLVEDAAEGSPSSPPPPEPDPSPSPNGERGEDRPTP